jgi:hypothetical protein
MRIINLMAPESDQRPKTDPRDVAEPQNAGEPIVMMRFGRLSDIDRSFDIEYWQRLGDTAIFRAAWDMVEFYYRQQGCSADELRLQSSIESFQRQPG